MFASATYRTVMLYDSYSGPHPGRSMLRACLILLATVALLAAAMTPSLAREYRPPARGSWGTGGTGGGEGVGGGRGSYRPQPPDRVRRLEIERVMREYQARHFTLRRWLPAPGDPDIPQPESVYVKWPDCLSCGGGGMPAPRYPEDDFYGEKLSHEQQAELVRSLASAFWGVERPETKVYTHFTKSNDPTGIKAEFAVTNLPHYAAADFPYIAPNTITTAASGDGLVNYVEVFEKIDRYVRQLKYVAETASQTTMPDNVVGHLKDASNSTDSCTAAKGLSNADWDSKPWVDVSGYAFNIAVAEATSRSTNGTAFSASLFARRGRIHADLRRYHPDSTAVAYVAAIAPAGGESNNPPVSPLVSDPDQTYYKRSSGLEPKAGTDWYSDPLADFRPQFTTSCETESETVKGWEILNQGVIVECFFDTTADPVECPTCTDGSCTMGGTRADVGSVAYAIGLGPVGNGGAGHVVLHESLPSPRLATPDVLRWTVSKDTSAVRVVKVDDVLSQVRTPTGLLDVKTDANNAYKYYVRLYAKGQVSNWADLYAESYTVTAGQENAWYKQVTVENPDFVPGQPLGAHNRLKITETTGATTEVKLFTWTEASKEWSLQERWDATTSTYARHSALTTTWNAEKTLRTETLTVRSGTATAPVVYKETTKYQVFPWGEEVAEHRLDPDGNNRTSTWTFYTDAVNDGNNYGRLKKLTLPDGYWERDYQYDSLGRITRIVRQYQNRPDTATEADSRIVEYQYAGEDLLGADGNPGTDAKNETKITILEKVGTQEVGRSYQVLGVGTDHSIEWHVRCRDAGAAWNAAANAVTITRSFKDAHAHEGKIYSVTQANGDLSRIFGLTVYAYTTETDGLGNTLAVTTVKSGVPLAASPGAVDFGTESRTKVHPMGASVEDASYPINSGITDTGTVLGRSWVPLDGGDYDLDPYGRAERRDHLDGTYETFSYGCCELESTRGTDGLTSVFEYDPLHRLRVATTQYEPSPGTFQTVGATRYTYDAVDRTTKVERKGSDGNWVADPVEVTQYDVAGRATKSTDAAGKSVFYTYGTESTSGKNYRETRTYPHDRASGPVSVFWTDGEGRVVRSFLASSATDWAGGVPTGAEALTALTREEQDYDWRGRVTRVRQYHDLAQSLYYETVNTYDGLDHLLRSKAPIGDVNASVHDASGRTLSQWRGTNDAGATSADPTGGSAVGNDMVKVAERFYDTNRDGTGALRPFVTRDRRLKPEPTVQFIDVDYEYDTKRRPEWVKPAAAGGPWTRTTYDDGGRVLTRTSYRNGSTSFILSRTSNTYSADKKLLTSVKSEFAGAGGTLTGKYTEVTFGYDGTNRQVLQQQAGRGLSKTEFDVLGRVLRQSVLSSEGATAANTDDTVLTETEHAYDQVDNVIQVTTLERNPDSSWAGPLAGSGHARISYTANWYDNAHRMIATADYGTNGGVALVRPATAPAGGSDNYILTRYGYDSAGPQSTVTDNKDKVTLREYDPLGRVTRVVENYTGNAPIGDADRTTRYVYDAAGNVVEQTADLPGAADQVTKYTYSSQLSDKGSIVKSNSLLRGVIYPDSASTVASGSFSGTDLVQMTYHADGSLRTRKDQRQTELTFTYYADGRRKSQRITNLGSDTDATVQAITYTYDDEGRLLNVTSHGNATDSPTDTSNVKNQVVHEYADYGPLLRQFQEHSGVKGASSLYVGYDYDTTSSGNAYSLALRPTKLYYPSSNAGTPEGRRIDYTYGTSGDIANHISRLDTIRDSAGNPIVAYRYAGTSRMLRKSYNPSANLRLRQAYDSTGTYSGLDRFGRPTTLRWEYYTATGAPDGTLFDLAYSYDRNSNRTYASSQVQTSASQSYAYDNLDRLRDFKHGLSRGGSIAPFWTVNKQNWNLDQVGNHVDVDEKYNADWSKNAVNAANEITQRHVRADTYKGFFRDSFLGNTIGDWDQEPAGAGDTAAVDTTSPGHLVVSGVAQDAGEGRGQAVLLWGGPQGSPSFAFAVANFPAGTTSGQAGLVFGYKSINDYWIRVADIGLQKFITYHVYNGNMLLQDEVAVTINAGTAISVGITSARAQLNGTLNLADGFPSGRFGVYTTVAGTKFDDIFVYNDAERTDLGGRWTDTGGMFISPGGMELSTWAANALNPAFLKGVRVKRFQATFAIARGVQSVGEVQFCFNGTDQDDFDSLVLYHYDTKVAPVGFESENGKARAGVASTRTDANMPALTAASMLWVQVSCDGTNVTVKCATSEAGLASASDCFSSGNFDISGGLVGFACYGGIPTVDNFTLKADRDNNGSYETTEHWDGFTLDASNAYVVDTPTHDAAGNLTYDGVFGYGYDAWNRLVRVTKKYRDAAGTLQSGSEIVVNAYDGLGRRVRKQVKNSADWDCTYAYYYDNHRVVETRNGSNQVLKQQVWGSQYVDELVQVAINDDPTDAAESVCESLYWAMQDANYNLLGVVDSSGVMRERYEYTPYGQRTPLFSVGTNDAGLYSPVLNSQRLVTSNGVGQPYGLCEYGHQGLQHEEEISLINNRARGLHATLGQFVQRDPMEYGDGMNSYQITRGNPVGLRDPAGREVNQERPSREGKGCCGPDMVGHLMKIREVVTTKFVELKPQDRTQLCWDILARPQPKDWLEFKFTGPDAWDIDDLATQSASSKQCGRGTGTCVGTATIWNECYFQEEVNYFLFGVAVRACFDQKAVKDWVNLGEAENEGMNLIKLYRFTKMIKDPNDPGTLGRLAFYRAGFHDDIAGGKGKVDITTVQVTGCTACQGNRPARPDRITGFVGRHGASYQIRFDVRE